MKDILGEIKLTFGFTFGVIIFILIAPVLLLLFPVIAYQNRKHKQEYQEFLNTHNGRKFFCYTSRKQLRNFVEDSILTSIDSDINVIFLNGKKPISDFPATYISRMLYGIDQIGFPNVMKIVDGKVIDISLKKEFYNEMNTHRDVSKITGMIHTSFQNIDSKGLT